MTTQQSAITLEAEQDKRDYADPEYWEHVVTEFTCGFCSELALTLHDSHGWRLMAEIAEDDGLYHAWVLDPFGRAIDINGLHPDRHARTWPDAGTRIWEISRDELAAFGLNHEGLAWAKEVLAARPALIWTPFDLGSSRYAQSWERHLAAQAAAQATT